MTLTSEATREDQHVASRRTSVKRNTQQRDAVAQVMRNTNGPLTIQEIFQRARRRCDLGIATVYRTVKILSQSGQIKAVILPDGRTRYEAAHLGHHHHFRCRDCDRVFDLDVCPVKINKSMTLPGGFHVDGHELTLYGTCPRCHGK